MSTGADARSGAHVASLPLLILLAVALLVVLLGSCRESDRSPVSEPYPGGPERRVAEPGRIALVEYLAPSESLLVRPAAPPGSAALIFFRGRGVAHDGDGRAYVVDVEGSRVLVVGEDLRVVRTVGGPSADDGHLGLPLSVAPTPAGGVYVVDVEHPKGLLYYEPSGRFAGAASPPVLNGELAAGPDGALWAARSPYLLGFDPAVAGDPLLYRFDPLAGGGVGIAEVEPIEGDAVRAGDSDGAARVTGTGAVAGAESVADGWNRLANAGAIAVTEAGVGAFAFLLRDELRGYYAGGALRWRSRRSLPFEPVTPVVVTVRGAEAELRFRPVTQALAAGPDGFLYSLTATDEAEERRRIEVWDPADGTLLRASTIPADWTTFAADRAGRVYRVDPARILASAPPAERRHLPEVALHGFDGDTTSFGDYRGKALLVNLWASWCAPCKEELPQLKAYYDELDRSRVEFLAISEDIDTAAARRFAHDFQLPFPLFFGKGRMRGHLHYIGLPYTLIVDYRGRIVEEIHGFGSEASWLRLTAALEREMERAVSDPEEIRGGLTGPAAEEHEHGADVGQDGSGREHRHQDDAIQH